MGRPVNYTLHTIGIDEINENNESNVNISIFV